MCTADVKGSVIMVHASLRIRLYAFLWDYLLIAAYGIIVVGSVSFILQPWLTPLFTSSPVLAQFTGFLMMTLPVSLYYLWSEHARWQGAWEKRKMNLRSTVARINLSWICFPISNSSSIIIIPIYEGEV